MLSALPGRAMSDLSLTIRPEAAADADAIERLHERTFGPGRYAKTAYRLREGGPHALALSFTARIGTLLVGSVRLTPVRIGETPALLLGPLTVEPPFRSRGVGLRPDRACARRGARAGPPAGRAGRRRALLRSGRLQARPRAAPSCPVRSIRSACWSPSSSRARSRACPDRSGRTGEAATNEWRAAAETGESVPTRCRLRRTCVATLVSRRHAGNDVARGAGPRWSR